MERVRDLLSRLYGPAAGESTFRDLGPILDRYRGRIPSPARAGLDQHDAILITYPDQVQEPGRLPLTSLREFCTAYAGGLVNGIHILPFYPWSSDDGFSVTDYEAVAPAYGGWEDIRSLGSSFRLMFDAVLNHASAESLWFRGFQAGDPSFRDYFIEVRGDPDLSAVVRPRAMPLLTTFDGPSGPRKLWTTFSADQVDLNYKNPRVLLGVLDLLLFYAARGAQFIRLDAIAYLWKEIGTSCISLPQVHWIVQLMRAVLDELAPHVMLITETNVPSAENLSYFGDGSHEAQLVYNFPLPPLVLHAILAGDASYLARWAGALKLPSPRVTFLNFLASHDGIGLNPARGILPDQAIDSLAHRIESAGGLISQKTNTDGTNSPYELNVNYFDALNEGGAGADLARGIQRFITAHAILLAFQGAPAIYFHSLFGSRGWLEGVRETGRSRSINRQKLDRRRLEQELENSSSLRAQIYRRLSALLKVRASHPAFSPAASQRVLDTHRGLFAFVREVPGNGPAVLCVHNVTDEEQAADLPLSGTSLALVPELRDAITGRRLKKANPLPVTLSPYENLWLTA